MLTNNLITQPTHPFLSYITDSLVDSCYPGSGWTFSKVLERFEARKTSFMLTSPDHDAFALWERVAPSVYLLECHAQDPTTPVNTMIELFSEGETIAKSFLQDDDNAGTLLWLYKPRDEARFPAFHALLDWWHLQEALLLDESLSGRAGLLKVGEVSDAVAQSVLPQAVETLTWDVPQVILRKRSCSLVEKPELVTSQ